MKGDHPSDGGCAEGSCSCHSGEGLARGAAVNEVPFGGTTRSSPPRAVQDRWFSQRLDDSLRTTAMGLPLILMECSKKHFGATGLVHTIPIQMDGRIGSERGSVKQKLGSMPSGVLKLD